MLTYNAAADYTLKADTSVVVVIDLGTKTANVNAYGANARDPLLLQLLI